ncbi:hypothetical protein ACJX0J_016601, partial [Zea mays]
MNISSVLYLFIILIKLISDSILTAGTHAVAVVFQTVNRNGKKNEMNSHISHYFYQLKLSSFLSAKKRTALPIVALDL